MEYINFDKRHIESFVSLLEGCTDDYMFYWEFKSDYYYISDSAGEVFDLPSGGFNNVKEILMKVVYEPDYAIVEKEIRDILYGKKMEHNLEYRWISKFGEPLWISCRGQVIRDDDGSAVCLVGRVVQLGKKQKADNLTGMLKEDTLEVRFNEAVSNRRSGYVMKMGIDNFKAINEKYGMQSGDRILKLTADYLRQACEGYDVSVFRFAGDEVAVFSESGADSTEAFEIYNRLKRIIEMSAEKIEYKIFYTISGGVVEYPGQSMEYAEIQRYLEFALNFVKRNGRNSIELFNRDNYERYIEQINLQEKLRKDIADDFRNFEVYYQPVVDIDTRTKTNRLSGAEALLRWRDTETGEMIPPFRFIPILEESGLIIPVGKWVLKEACSRCAEWRKYIPHFKVSVNVSYIQIKRSDIFSDVWECMNETGLKDNAVVLELTESGYIDTDAAIIKIMEMFREQNIKVALDDFGTGYSNLRYLKDLQVDTLKIDRSFVCKALEEEYDYELIKNIIRMAHSINLKVCLEGIETKEELDMLSVLLPDYIQGYLFGRPVCAKQFYEEHILKSIV